MNAPFEYAERLAALVKCQQEIEDELDLTKNQGSAQLGADDVAKEQSAAASEADSLKEFYDGEWF